MVYGSRYPQKLHPAWKNHATALPTVHQAPSAQHRLAIDFEEVTVARRLYRSGESEYLINGNLCRLKQVSELFYDTGIGKEGYSIIGQGQIDRILSGKPEGTEIVYEEAV